MSTQTLPSKIETLFMSQRSSLLKRRQAELLMDREFGQPELFILALLSLCLRGKMGLLFEAKANPLEG